MSITRYGRTLASAAFLLICTGFLVSPALAQTFWAGDVSISNITSPPTQAGADIAHVSLVISNTGQSADTLVAVDVPIEIAEAAGFDALSTRIYRGASLRRSQPVFFKSGETRFLGFEDVHLVLYGVRGQLKRGHLLPVRLTFQNAGVIDIVVQIGSWADHTVSGPASVGAPQVVKTRYQVQAAKIRQAEPATGSAFRCEDGSKMVLDFDDTRDGSSAVIWLNGASYSLPHQPPEPGLVQIVWSDGGSSLTWSPGVQLMWMSGGTHLMCGRGGHKH